jgi:hypothetical protein
MNLSTNRFSTIAGAFAETGKAAELLPITR